MPKNSDIKTHNEHIKKVLSGVALDDLTKEERWHLDRRLGIGGSDIGSILHINPYKTPHQVWLEKTGRVEPQDLSGIDRVHFGNVLEDVVAKEYARRTAQKVAKRNSPFVHENQPWLRANLDRVVVGQRKVLECKTAGAWTAKHSWGESGTDEVPESYCLQVTHYMNVLGWDKADLAVLIGGNDFRVYHFDLNHDLCAYIDSKLREFWFNCVIADVPPVPVTLEEINQFYARDNGSSVCASDAAMIAIAEYKNVMSVKKEAEAILKQQEAIIKECMQDGQVLVDASGNKLATWKEQEAKRFDTSLFTKEHADLAAGYIKKSTNRVFRV